MYTACLFCHADLGRNEVVDAFPVGRRLAFDGAKGRLWVVCRGCERWNLSPLEERWEAIETCERLYRAARVRASTSNIGLARLRDGLELVRVGAPERPELAAWRYGDQFGRRRRIALLRGGLAAGAVGAVVLGAESIGIGIGGAWWMLQGLFSSAYDTAVHGTPDKVVVRLTLDRRQLVVRRKHLQASAILRGDNALVVSLQHDRGLTRLEGDDATVAARQLLPHANRTGATKSVVQEAVGMIERIGDADRAVWQLATVDARHASRDRPLGLGYVRRLAIEMALHEEQERRALDGELQPLVRAWQEAEEIARIADGMFVSDAVTLKLDAMKRDT